MICWMNFVNARFATVIMFYICFCLNCDLFYLLSFLEDRKVNLAVLSDCISGLVETNCSCIHMLDDVRSFRIRREMKAIYHETRNGSAPSFQSLNNIISGQNVYLFINKRYI